MISVKTTAEGKTSGVKRILASLDETFQRAPFQLLDLGQAAELYQNGIAGSKPVFATTRWWTALGVFMAHILLFQV